MNNLIDRVIGYFDPHAGLKRAQARTAMSFARQYDISSKSPRNNGWKRPKTTASQEVSAALNEAMASGQELCRNNPLAKRAKRVIAASTVGAGIRVKFVHEDGKPNKKQERQLIKLNKKWKRWAKGRSCDFDGHHTFYGLQFLWMSTIVESGGVFIRKHVTKTGELELQSFEQSHLDRAKSGSGTDTDVDIVDGMEYRNGKLAGYWLYDTPTQTLTHRHLKQSKFYPVDDIVHIFLKDRTGQHLGITWFDASANILRNYEIYKDAKLMQQQIAACFALFVEEGSSAGGLAGELDTELPDEVTPGMVEKIANGQTPHVVTPPKADASTNFDIGLKRDIAVGVGTTYESMTGDNSQTNFASGRMGRIEFHQQLDIYQHIMLEPALDIIATWFMDLFEFQDRSINSTKEFEPNWTFPPRLSVDPKIDFDHIISQVRNGMMSPSEAAQKLGKDFIAVIKRWKEDKELLDGLPFDFDPSMFSSAGNQIDEDDTASGTTNNQTKGENDE
ncbi:phage portal protein [Pseudoalteromonas sp. DL2-H2.2]|uniref:phage portal protein n=1 Tax=Pseudoalteromonas sp. DL2-H2.2 TaxID=2908889 RepID=UPI001F433CD8|nr:phage portal protein [Pseudoalteromonas sp. DL2-H2.2]MCF2909982.1 phage portal protein [Pseudoalteromonas sp. DL2-H2.2]